MKKYFKVRISLKVTAGYIAAGIAFAVIFYMVFSFEFHGKLQKDGFIALIILSALLPMGAGIIRFIKGELIIEEEGLKTEKGFIKFLDIKKIMVADEKKWQKILKIGDMIITSGHITVEVKNIDKPEKLSDLLSDLRGED